MTRFRVYYSDGSTFDGDPVEAPGTGVLVVKIADPDVGWFLIHERDYYLWEPEHGRWWGADFAGLVLYLARPGWRKVIFGQTVTNEQFRQVYNLAASDGDGFDVKSARRPDERG